MVAMWPAELPRPMRDGFQIGTSEGRLKKRNDVGPPGYRRRFSSVARPVSLVLDVTRNERARFEKFYDEEIAEGSLPFLMSDPTTAGWQLLTHDGLPLTDHNGRPLLLEKTWLCLMGDQLPSTTVIGVRFRIAFQVTVMP